MKPLLALCSMLVPLAAGAQARRASMFEGVVDLVIGGPNDERDDYLIHATSGLQLDNAGRIYVGESKGGTVRIFSPAGELLARFGQSGQGPGDLAQPSGFAFDLKGLLWVTDGRNRRFSAFDVAGARPRFVRSIQVPQSSSSPYRPAIWDASGNIVYESSRRGATGWKYRRVVLRPDGTMAADLPVPEVANPTPQAELSKPVPGAPAGTSAQIEFGQPYGGWVGREYASNGDVVALHTGTYLINWYDKDLKLLRTLRRSVSGPKVTAAEKDTAEKMLSDYAKEYGVTRASLRMKVPDVKPPIDRVGFDLDGRLWVSLTVPDGAPHQADVYDRNGALQRVVHWPANVDLYRWVARDSIAIGIARDEDGTPSVVRLQFRPAR